ncbi:MAG: glycosyltransferase family 4 protein [Chloroflexi bacterium]|nr:glycosyltransferase family 4 protein [Chloroflexota bacterium]
MKVCFVGNEHNSSYVLTKLLRRKGIDAHLILLGGEPDESLPEREDSFLKNGYPEWIKKVDWGYPLSFFRVTNSKLKADTGEADIYVSCNFGPAFLSRLNLKRSVILPYGSDIYAAAFPKHWYRQIIKRGLRSLPLLPAAMVISGFQKRGIHKADAISIIPSASYGAAIKKMNLQHKCLPMHKPLDLEKFNNSIIEKELSGVRDKNLLALLSRRKEYDMVVFSPTRHCWGETIGDHADDKRNDLLIEAFARLVLEGKSNPLLVLIETGESLAASKELIRNLGIEKNIFWAPHISREMLRYYYCLADIVGDQYKVGMYGLIALEAFACEKPVMVYIAGDYEKAAKRPFPPCLNVRTAEEIYSVLRDFSSNKNKYLNIGKEARNWMEKYYGNGLTDEFIRLFEHILEGKDIKRFIPFEKHRE